MQKSLRQKFNETAAAAQAAFPERLQSLTILLVPTSDTPVYVAPAVAEQLAQDIAGVKDTVERLRRDMYARGWAGVANGAGYVGKTRVNLIALRGDLPGIFYKSCTREMRELYVLDHELGHHVTEKGAGWAYSGEMKESAADAYAVLRHIQRFGKNTHFITKRARCVAQSAVLHLDSAHYTSATILRACAIAEEQDISNLSLRDTAVLAQKIADATYMDEDKAIKLLTAYAPVNFACRAKIGGTLDVFNKIMEKDSDAYALFCRETLAVMRQNADDADIFLAGKRFLTGYPAIRQYMKKQAKADAFYRDALTFLEQEPPAREQPTAKTAHPAPRCPTVRKIIG